MRGMSNSLDKLRLVLDTRVAEDLDKTKVIDSGENLAVVRTARPVNVRPIGFGGPDALARPSKDA